MDTRDIMNRLYPRWARPTWRQRMLSTLSWLAKLVGRPFVRRARLHPVTREEERRRKVILIAIGVFVVTTVLTFVYYYNRLTRLEFDIKAAAAQIKVLQERRHNIQANVSGIVKRYSRYERGVLMDLTELRTAPTRPGAGARPAEAPPAAPPAPDLAALADALARIRVVAEQYPALHLTENVQQLADSIVQNERDIADRTVTYNDAVNQYTTVLKQFPGNLFGAIAGFDDYDFYDPASNVELGFKAVEL